jgi:hypothetical protein
MKNVVFFPVLTLFLSVPAGLFAENGVFWLGSAGETAMYSTYGFSSPAYGGALTLGYGKGTSIGLKTSFFTSQEGLNTLEINFLFRCYFTGTEAVSGPFLQAMGGPAIFLQADNGINLPSLHGMISGGLGFGWTFLFKNRWFIEPSIRGGYPYIIGAGISAGMRI